VEYLLEDDEPEEENMKAGENNRCDEETAVDESTQAVQAISLEDAMETDVGIAEDAMQVDAAAPVGKSTVEKKVRRPRKKVGTAPQDSSSTHTPPFIDQPSTLTDSPGTIKISKKSPPSKISSPPPATVARTSAAPDDRNGTC
jgi:hypothetical protein